MSFPVTRFYRTVEAWDIPFFEPGELLVKGASHHDPDSRAYGLNTDPPEDLWGSMEDTLSVASLAREEVGPILITSAYRSPEYNRAVGGVPGSQHTLFTALDLIPMDSSVRDLHLALQRMRRDGVWVGGLGRYSNFIHIDTRGRNASWG
jgi:uncharacterized protein YcbK (DUF882 family)